MPSNNRRRRLQTLLIAVILLLIIQNCILVINGNKTGISIKANYFAEPILTVERVITKPWHFKHFVRLEPAVWINYVLRPIYQRVRWPRNYYLNGRDGSITKESSICIANRVFRSCMIWAGVKPRAAAFFSDQDVSVVLKDVKHLAFVIVQVLQDVHLDNPAPGSAEYNSLRGKGNFEPFPSVVYAGDITKVKIRRPLHHQRQFYDGHHKIHSAGFLCFVDGDGICRAVHGPEIGRKNDQQTWYDSSWAGNNINTLIAIGDHILFDGAYRYIADYFLTPFPGRLDPNSEERRWNRLQSNSRVIVENYFGLHKRLWPIFGSTYPWMYNRIGITFRCCVILTNIYLKYQSPMRAH